MRAAWVIGAGLVAVAAFAARAPLARLFDHPAERAAAVDRAPATGDARGDAPGSASPPPARLSGAVSVDLRAIAPASRYLDTVDEDGADAEYRAAVAGLGRRDVAYDPHLGRAARELAAQHAALGAPPPEAALAFLLHSAGAPEASAGQYLVATGDEGGEVIADAVRSALAAPPPGSSTILVGVGEAAVDDQPLSRHVAVLLARRDYALEPAPRRVEPGASLVLRGLLPTGYHDLQGIVLYSDDRIVEIPVVASAGRFRLEVPAGDRPGVLQVAIDGSGRDGPGKLLQVDVTVGAAPSASIVVDVPPPDPPLADQDAAEALALELLQRDRARHGLDRLISDPALVAVARAHAADMRDAGFFGHHSPTTGLLGDRLRAAGYRASAHGENLARNDSLGEAEASLMASIGHRKNLLDRDFTHVGVGVVAVGDGGHRDWLLVQVMARKVIELDPVTARTAVLERINRERAAAGVAAVTLEPALSAVAQRGAQAAASGSLDGLAGRIAAEVRPLVDTRADIGVQAIYDLGQLEVPEALSLDRFAELADDFDAWVRRTPDIDPFCSSSDWVLPAAAELMPPREPFLWRGGAGWVAMMRGVHPQGWRYLEPLEASWGLACPLIGPDADALAAEFTRLVRRAEDEWDVLLLSGLPSRSRLRAQLQRRLGAHYELAQQGTTVRHVADLRGGVDAFLARRSRNFRRSLQRSQRRAAAAGIEFEAAIPRDPAAADAVFQRSLVVERSSWKGRAGMGIDTPGFGDFYRHMLRRLAARGGLRARFARHRGADVGFVIGGVLDRGYRGLQMSYHQAYRGIGLGNLLQWGEIASLCAEGFESYDLGTGLDYKQRWAEAVMISDVLIVLKLP